MMDNYIVIATATNLVNVREASGSCGLPVLLHHPTQRSFSFVNVV